MRNLWSAHIFSLENEIYDLIGMLCGSSIVSLQRLIQRVCIQLSDLSAPIAVFVIKAVLDAFKKHIVSESSDIVEKILAFVQALLDQVRCSKYKPTANKLPTTVNAQILDIQILY